MPSISLPFSHPPVDDDVAYIVVVVVVGSMGDGPRYRHVDDIIDFVAMEVLEKYLTGDVVTDATRR